MCSRAAARPGFLVDQAVGGHHQVIPQLGVQGLVQCQFVERGAHMAQPGVTFCFSDGEARVAHPQPRVAALLAVGSGAAPVLDQEQPQVLLGRPEIPARVYRPEQRIPGDFLVEPAYQAAEGLFPAHGLVEALLGCLIHAVHQGTCRGSVRRHGRRASLAVRPDEAVRA